MEIAMRRTLLLMLVVSLVACTAGKAERPRTTVDAGTLVGVDVDDVHAFRGIPYAAPPIGDARFLAPSPARPWTGAREAGQPGPRCAQLRVGDPAAGPANLGEEDCLVLDVFSRGLRDGARRPVMVWVHGGGFSVGSGSEPATDGTRLARRGDVVVVTVNHRLNVFGYGYFATQGQGFPTAANLGQLDLIAALQWVRANIEAFGGDPGNVTLFGQSGGGAKIGNLLATPAARGLFHKAILQSGPGLTAKTIDEQSAIARDYLAAAGVPRDEPERLRKLSTQQLLDALRKVTGGDPTLGFAPMVDGEVLPRQPFTPDAPDLAAEIPVLVGYTKTETTVLFPTPDLFSLDAAGLRAKLAPFFPGRNVDDLVARLGAALPDATPSRLYFVATSELNGDRSWLLAARKAAQRGAPVWLYRLEWETPVEGGRLMSPHGLDVPLVFDNVGSTATTRGEAEAGARQVAETMSRAWLNFARNGDPNGPGVSEWPPFDPERKATMRFDLTPGAVDDPVGEIRSILLGR
ncbi:MAG: carboxylesterase/lipase family protein [Proteobacteria bacterium]|nr:MAG: carboxylesterase/lipase family protein [Pseudomonadota bacterium]